ESETATARDLDPVEGDLQAFQLLHEGGLIQHRGLEILDDCQCRGGSVSVHRHGFCPPHLALRSPTVVFSKILTSSESPSGSSSSSSSISFTVADRVRGCTVSCTRSPMSCCLSHAM